jgi:transcriptional regulator with XRE-family HTH domain
MLRARYQLTQKELAGILGVYPEAIMALESDDPGDPLGIREEGYANFITHAEAAIKKSRA